MKTTECGCLCHTTLKGLAESAIQLFPCEHCHVHTNLCDHETVTKPISEESWEEEWNEWVDYQMSEPASDLFKWPIVLKKIGEIRAKVKAQEIKECQVELGRLTKYWTERVAKAHAEGYEKARKKYVDPIRKRQRNWKLEGKCVSCGKNRTNSKVFCDHHLSLDMEAQRLYRKGISVNKLKDKRDKGEYE